LCQICHMLAYKVATGWVIQNWKTPGIAEGDDVRLSGIVLEIQDSKHCYLLSCDARAIYSLT